MGSDSAPVLLNGSDRHMKRENTTVVRRFDSGIIASASNIDTLNQEITTFGFLPCADRTVFVPVINF